MKINNQQLGVGIILCILIALNSVWFFDLTNNRFISWALATVFFDLIVLIITIIQLIDNEWEFEIEIKNPFVKSERQKEIDDKLEKLSLDLFNAKDNTEVDLILKKKEAIEAIQLIRN